MKKNIALLCILGCAVAASFAPGAAADGTPLSAVGAATPAAVAAGGTTLLTLAVTPADTPPSTEILATCQLSPIGGSLTLLTDDGTQGDVKAGDLVFSLAATIPAGVTPGDKTLDCAVSDAQARVAVVTIELTVTPAVQNQPPIADAGGPYAVDEGSSVTLTATGSDPDGGSVGFAWDLDGNGTYETPGQSVSFAGTDGPAVQTVSVQVTDDEGTSTVASTTVTVNNLAPTGTLTAPAQAEIGSTFEVTLGSLGDASAADAAALEVAFDCGSGNSDFAPAAGSAPATCSADDAGPQTVRATVRDKDGGATEYSAVVEVVVTADALCNLTEQAVAADKPWLAHALCVKLGSGQLDAYRNQLAAQSGKAISADDAERLSQLSRLL